MSPFVLDPHVPFTRRRREWTWLLEGCEVMRGEKSESCSINEQCADEDGDQCSIASLNNRLKYCTTEQKEKPNLQVTRDSLY